MRGSGGGPGGIFGLRRAENMLCTNRKAKAQRTTDKTPMGDKITVDIAVAP